MTILLVFLRFAWPYLLAAAVLGGLWYAEEHHCNAACRSEAKRADASEAREAAAKKRATDLALLWSAQVDKTESAAKARKASHDATFAVLTNRARSVPAGATVRFHVDSFRLFNDASRIANAATAAPVPFAAPDGVSPSSEANTYAAFDEGELRTFVVTAAQAYADAVGQYRACVDFYLGLRLQDQLH